ncbi:DUF222 domain-containing protein [Planococcus sp. APC 4015]|nr:DUF222 domain-containing protein [Planococcus sp. APC 4015]
MTTSTTWMALDALVSEVEQARALVAAAQAREAEALARAVDLVQVRRVDRRAAGVAFGNDLPLREVSAELGAAMRVGDRTVQRRIDDAHTLVTGFPATLTAWREGRIDRGHVSAIVDEGVVIVDETLRARFEEAVLTVAVVESAGRLRPIARVVAARIDPDAAQRRRVAAVRSRDVRVIDLPDNLARLQADLAAPLAYGILDRINQLSRTVHDGEKDERGRDVDAARCAAGPDAGERDAARPDAGDSDQLVVGGTDAARDAEPTPGTATSSGQESMIVRGATGRSCPRSALCQRSAPMCSPICCSRPLRPDTMVPTGRR